MTARDFRPASVNSGGDSTRCPTCATPPSTSLAIAFRAPRSTSIIRRSRSVSKDPCTKIASRTKGRHPGPQTLRPKMPVVWEVHPVKGVVFEPWLERWHGKARETVTTDDASGEAQNQPSPGCRIPRPSCTSVPSVSPKRPALSHHHHHREGSLRSEGPGGRPQAASSSGAEERGRPDVYNVPEPVGWPPVGNSAAAVPDCLRHRRAVLQMEELCPGVPGLPGAVVRA